MLGNIFVIKGFEVLSAGLQKEKHVWCLIQMEIQKMKNKHQGL